MSLGEKTGYPDRYSPDLLEALSRQEDRRVLGIEGALPFHGVDLWNAYEITWLDRRGKPAVATAAMRVPAASPCIVESKSLKLYLNSLAMSGFDTGDDVAATIAADLSKTTGSSVDVELAGPADVIASGVGDLPGACIDDGEVDCRDFRVERALLRSAAGPGVDEALYTHLFRSNCPVTGQPDFGSVLVRYRGAAINRASLLRYLVSYRLHCAFHENCIERIFIDLQAQCRPAALTVYGRFNRRGGIDINPFRSDFERPPDNRRSWRQ